MPPAARALLFENLKGYPGGRVLMNQFGSERRMKLALNVSSLDEVAGRIESTAPAQIARKASLEKLKMLPMLAEVGRFFPRTHAAKDAPCKDVILRENLSVLDFPRASSVGRWMAAASLLLPCVITRDPKRSRKSTQRGHVSHASLRRANDGHALATAEGSRGTPPRSAAGGSRRRCFRGCTGRARKSDGGGRQREQSGRWKRPCRQSLLPKAKTAGWK